MSDSFMIATRKPMRCAALRHIGPHPSVIDTWRLLVPMAEQVGLWPPAGRIGSVFPVPGNDEADEELVSFAVIEISAAEAVPESLESITVAGGEYVSYVHEGAMADLIDVWPWFWKTARRTTGREPLMTPFLEEYLHNPATDAGEIKIVLSIPLAQR